MHGVAWHLVQTEAFVGAGNQLLIQRGGENDRDCQRREGQAAREHQLGHRQQVRCRVPLVLTSLTCPRLIQLTVNSYYHYSVAAMTSGRWRQCRAAPQLAGLLVGAMPALGSTLWAAGTPARRLTSLAARLVASRISLVMLFCSEAAFEIPGRFTLADHFLIFVL